VLLTHAPIEAAAAAAASVVIPAFLLLGLAAFHCNAPLRRRRPWLTALGAGPVLSPALPVMASRAPPDTLSQSSSTPTPSTPFS